jgi:hypothetical protein
VIVAFSTSSPWASVAAISENGVVLWEDAEEAPRRAGAACMAMVERLNERFPLSSCTLFAADIGPGSFTGVRVGVTLAKTFGYVHHQPVAGADSFDLIAHDAVAVLPSKKGEYFVRRPGEAPFRTNELPDEPFLGFGPGIDPSLMPMARRFAFLLDRLEPTTAELFVPEYLIQPSISTPKKPYAQRGPS